MLWDRILAFARRPEFGPQLIVASNLFWNGSYGVDGLNALDRFDLGRFLDWCVLDYRLEGSRKRIIELFSDGVGASLSSADSDRLAAWKSSLLSLYRVVSQQQAGSIQVVDLLGEVEPMMVEVAPTQLGSVGDLWLGRILPASNPRHFSWGAALLPAVSEPGLVSFMRAAYARHQEANATASWSDFLSHNGYLSNHHLLRQVSESGAGRHFGAVYYDASRTVERLREVEHRLREEAVKRAEEARRSKQGQEPSEGSTLRQTRGGILLPGDVKYRGSKILKP